MPIYDVENRYSYYKSYTDNILVGPPKPTIGSYVWNRTVSGSIVSGSQEWKTANVLSDYVFGSQNPFYKSGEVRYLRLISANQTIKDSITPNILDIYQTGSVNGSGSIVFPNSMTLKSIAGISLKLYFSIDGAAITASYGAIGARINNIEWYTSFPYEKKYSYVRDYNAKILPFAPTFADKVVGTFPTFIQFDTHPANEPTTSQKISIYLTKKTTINTTTCSLFLDQTGSYNGTSFDNSSDPSFFISTIENTNVSQRIVFGFNPSPLASNSFTVGSQDKYVFCTGSFIEGWKYGLYNGFPTNFSCVFRQNHYGQFRDMLEGRPYTKTFNNPKVGGPMDTNGGINFISGSALSGESDNYLTASIYQEKNITSAYAVNPYGSGIFDKEYRASQPWHDDDPRSKNRNVI